MCSMATPAGFEPATIRLEGECSIQLSYGAGKAGLGAAINLAARGLRRNERSGARAL